MTFWVTQALNGISFGMLLFLLAAGLSLIYVWVPLFFFFVISLFVGKKTGVYL